MSTAAPAAPRVEYDEQFAARPELMRAARRALEELDTNLGTSDLVPPPSVTRWHLDPDDPSFVRVSMADDAEGLHVSRTFPASSASDPRRLGLLVNRVWRALLSERLRVGMPRLDQQIADFARGIADSGSG